MAKKCVKGELGGGGGSCWVSVGDQQMEVFGPEGDGRVSCLTPGARLTVSHSY